MNWSEKLAEQIELSNDGDTVYVLNETRAELAQRAAARLRKNITIVVLQDDSRLSDRERWIKTQVEASVARNRDP